MIFGKNKIKPVNWLKAGLTRSRAIARVENEDTQGITTGFLLDGTVLGEQFAEEPLLVTVDYAFTRRPNTPEPRFRAVFQGLFDDDDAVAEVSLHAVLWSSSQLHAAVCLLSDWPGDVRGLRPAARVAEAGDDVWILGYPRGGDLSISLADNDVVSRDGPRLNYRADTEPGSGGSPVMNEFWEVVAIHVGKEATAASNFGTSIEDVVAAATDALTHVQPARPKQSATRGSPSGLDGVSHSYASVFISYSTKDGDFATRLAMTLKSHGVRCWFDKEDLLPGQRIDRALRDGIRSHDRVILCCSTSSLGDSWWVENELEQVFERERDVQRNAGANPDLVVPLDLDGHVHKWDGAKGAQLRARKAADFTQWREPTEFGKAVQLLLRALQPR